MHVPNMRLLCLNIVLQRIKKEEKKKAGDKVEDVASMKRQTWFKKQLQIHGFLMTSANMCNESVNSLIENPPPVNKPVCKHHKIWSKQEMFAAI